MYAALLDSLDGGRCYRSSADLDVDGLSGKQIGSALKQLAHAEDCPLAIERWTGANTTPAVWSVERNSATDGGLSEHVGRINGFGEGPDWCRCQECGATGDRPENINHRERCPGESGGVR